MNEMELREQVLSAWIGLNGMLKDSQMTQGLTYNESIIMKLVYDQYRKDGVGSTAVQYIVKRTNMLKSLVNRTVNALCAQGYLEKQRDQKDGRSLTVRPVAERLPEFERIHQQSLKKVGQIIQIIGEADAERFVQMCRKLDL